jgi:hypothetical protein
MKQLLRFDKPAKELYIGVANEIEENMRPGGLYDNATDHASKLMENIARVAGILHVINKNSGDITYETLDTAIHTCIFYSKEYMRVFDSTPQHVIDAMILNDWLTANVRSQNIRYISKRYTRQYAPSSIRKPGRFKDALEHLECNGSIKLLVDEKRTCFIDTMPQIFT